MDKGLFGANCEDNNVLNNLIGSLAAPEHRHAFGPESMDVFQDLWEESEAQMLHHEQQFHDMGDLEQAWIEPTPDENLEQAWSDPNLENLWSQSNPVLEQESIKNSAKSIMSVLSLQGDPKYTNSEFFRFVEKLHSGKAKIQGNELIEDFEDVWTASNEPPQEAPQESLFNGLTPDDQARLEEAWQQVQSEREDEAALLAAWGQAWEQPSSSTNKYEGQANLQETAEELLKKGEFNEAILALEAELKQNPDNSEGWTVLGKLYSDLDRDDQALRCFQSGLEVDPYNTDLLFNAGVSSVSQFDDRGLVMYFARWLVFNVDYAGIIIPQGAPLEGVLQGFLSAMEINPQDFQLNIGIGLMYFAMGNLEAAEYYLQVANMMKEGQFEVFNKLGAVLMQQTKYNEAILCFQKSLEGNQEYVKAWVNLGKCYAVVGDLRKAVGCYLTAGTVYESDHLLELARSAFELMGRQDLVEKLRRRNPLEFSDEFEVINLKN